MSDAPPPARNVSPYSQREKIGRALWAVVYTLFFRLSYHNFYNLRAWILRQFGATIGRNVRLRRTVRIEIPWNLNLSDDVSIGDHVILYALGPIKIGSRTFISQYAHLCAGSHDYTRSDYPLLRLPITIGEDCWIAADAFVGPNVTIGDRTVVGARASAFDDLPSDVVAVGNPAKAMKPRVFTAGH